METVQDAADWRKVWATCRLGPMVNNHPAIVFQAAQLLYGRGQRRAAEAAFQEVLERAPDHQAALNWLAALLENRGCRAEAAAYRKRGLAITVEALGVPAAARGEVEAFLLAAEGHGPPPPRAPAAFVAAHFDRFAARFDGHLVDNLQYRGPELLRAALARLGPPPGPVLDVLDAGCGTGLAGPLFRPWARRLDGVDLSPAMLERARERGVYDGLEVGELVEVLAGRPDSYDLIIAADVLIYFGDLTPVLTAVRKALRREGRFALTVEAAAEPAYALCGTGRYTHALDYLRRSAAAAGLEEAGAEEAVLRLQSSEPVPAYVVVLRRGM
jgi:predicted TPR repeat methyltransferase